MRLRLKFPSRRTRIWFLVGVAIVCAVGMNPWYVYPLLLPTNATEGWFPTQRVHDEAGFLSRRDRVLYERALGGALDESGADLQFVFVRGVPGGDLPRYALERMRTLGVGRTVNGQGMLLVYDLASKRLRIEVGPHLEGVFPDGFLGYLMRENAASFFATPEAELGLRLTLRIIMWRMRDASLGLAYDPTPVTFITDSVRLASGGGATARAGAGVTSPGFIGRRATPAEREYFSAQPTPELAHSRYIDWLHDGQKQIDVELFTPETRTFMRTQHMTRAYNDFILLSEYGQKYAIEERGTRAMLYFTSTPFVSPHFLRHTEKGWQMDLIADMMNSAEVEGFALTYTILNSDDDYSYAFADMMEDWGPGWMRVRDGDNRQMPVHTAPKS